MPLFDDGTPNYAIFTPSRVRVSLTEVEMVKITAGLTTVKERGSLSVMSGSFPNMESASEGGRGSWKSGCSMEVVCEFYGIYRIQMRTRGRKSKYSQILRTTYLEAPSGELSKASLLLLLSNLHSLRLRAGSLFPKWPPDVLLGPGLSPKKVTAGFAIHRLQTLIPTLFSWFYS